MGMSASLLIRYLVDWEGGNFCFWISKSRTAVSNLVIPTLLKPMVKVLVFFFGDQVSQNPNQLSYNNIKVFCLLIKNVATTDEWCYFLPSFFVVY